MITVALHGVAFFAYHGFYTEEQKLGTNFILDIEVDFDPVGSLKSDKISNTVDYEQLYEIADRQMKHTRKLIETVAHAIADEIKEQYTFAKSIRVLIKKLSPAMRGKVDYSSILITV